MTKNVSCADDRLKLSSKQLKPINPDRERFEGERENRSQGQRERERKIEKGKEKKNGQKD